MADSFAEERDRAARAWEREHAEVTALRAQVAVLTEERDAARVEFNAWEEERDRADAEEERAERAEARVAVLEAGRAAIEALHHRDPNEPSFCAEDGFIWPCNTARALLSTGEGTE